MVLRFVGQIALLAAAAVSAYWVTICCSIRID
jgi:hypothetical protein